MKHQGHEATARDATQLTELVDEVRLLWHRMTRGWSQQTALNGLQRQQFWVLAALAKGPRRMSELATCAQTSQASLTGIVDRMEEHGLVERVRSSEDRRVVEVAATPAGREVLEVAHRVMTDGLEQLIEPLSDAERDQLLGLLRKVTRRPTA